MNLVIHLQEVSPSYVNLNVPLVLFKRETLISVEADDNKSNDEVNNSFNFSYEDKIPHDGNDFNISISLPISENFIEISDDEIDQPRNPSPTYKVDAELADVDLVFELKDYNEDKNCNENGETEAINQSIHDLLTRSFSFMDKSFDKPFSSSQIKSSGSSNWRKSVSAQQLTTRNSTLIIDRPSTSRTPQSLNKSIDMSNDDYIIHIGSTSSKPDYEHMDTNCLQEELSKFGLKRSLRRYQAIIVLEYIYNRTNPYIEDCKVSAIKSNDSKEKTKRKELIIDFNFGFSKDNLVDIKFKENPPEDLYFPTNPRSKRPWCIQPLHIAWHNLVKANIELNNAILNYTPFSLRELKLFFKAIDMNFENKVKQNSWFLSISFQYSFIHFHFFRI